MAIQFNFQLSPDFLKSMDRLRETMQQVAQQMDRTTRPLAKLLSERLRPGTFSGDLVLLLEDFDDTERLAAAERLAKWIPYPIHSKRWPLIEKALKERAADHERAPATELRDMVKAAIFEAGGPIWDEHPETAEQAANKLRNKVETIITNDLLGEGWRSEVRKAETNIDDHLRKNDTRDIDESKRDHDDDLHKLERQLELESHWEDLTPAQQELVAAMYESGGVITDAAETLGKSPSTACTHLQKIRKKFNLA